MTAVINLSKLTIKIKMATGPRLPDTPLEILEDRGTAEIPFLSKFWGPTICAAVALSASIFGNFAIKRPLFSGIQRHVLITVSGAVIGKWAEDYRNDYFAERDAVYRHYIQLHPEDFPPYDRKKFGEVFEPWVPIRS